MRVIGIIPAHNEEASVADVVHGLKRYVDEVIVINDGSTDRTVEFAEKAGARVVSHAMKRGLGLAIRHGYQEALAMGADIVVQIDADGQYTVEDVPKLVKPIIDGEADMMIASRVKGGIEDMPLGKRLGNRIGTFVTRTVSGAKITDAQSGFRAIRAELLRDIQPTSRYTYVQEMIICAAKEGWKVAEVPSYFKRRQYGPSRLIGSLFGYLGRAALITFRAVRDYRPMIFFGIPGLLLLLGGLALGAYLVDVWFEIGSFAGHTASVMLTALLIISGGLFIFMGMLADMMQQKYFQIRALLKLQNKVCH